MQSCTWVSSGLELRVICDFVIATRTRGAGYGRLAIAAIALALATLPAEGHAGSVAYQNIRFGQAVTMSARVVTGDGEGPVSGEGRWRNVPLRRDRGRRRAEGAAREGRRARPRVRRRRVVPAHARGGDQGRRRLVRRGALRDAAARRRDQTRRGRDRVPARRRAAARIPGGRCLSELRRRASSAPSAPPTSRA